MTGNNKVWRAPVAGLASAAMLATLGVTTANADPISDTPDGTYEVSYVDANGDKQKMFDVITGDSILDYLNGQTDRMTSDPGMGAGKTFIGWYYNGEPVDYTAPVTADMTLTPVYAETVATVDFTAAASYIGFLPGDQDKDNKITLPANSSMPATMLPTDKADQKVVTAWKVTYPNGAVQTVSDLTEISWQQPQGEIKVEVAEYDLAKTVTFTTNNSVYALNAYADGDGNATLNLDVTAETEVPAIVAKASGDSYMAYSQWLDAANHAVTTVPAETGTYTLGGQVTYNFVKFDSRGGSKVAGQYVEEGKCATAPEAPTREGYTFKGWSSENNDNGAVFDFNTQKINSATTIFAAWNADEMAAVDVQVTFQDAEYNGSHDAESIVVSSDELIADQTPEWTREGYVLAGWSASGSAPVLDLQTTVAGSLNGRKDAVLKAVWVEITTDVAKAALKYVTADDENLFTADSWKTYEKALTAAQKKYDDAVADTLGQIDAATSAEIVTDLNEAWAGLQFKNASGTDTVTNVHRLSKGGEHFYSSDEDEIAFLTLTISTSGNWVDEGNLLYSLDTENTEKFADFEAAVEAAEYKGAEAKAQVLAELSAAATPIVNLVNRVYNTVTGDHVWTVDAHEYEVLSGQVQWTGEGTAFAVPAYNGLRTVTRLYKDNRHLLSTDGNEVKVLSEQYGWTNEGTAFLAY